VSSCLNVPAHIGPSYATLTRPDGADGGYLHDSYMAGDEFTLGNSSVDGGSAYTLQISLNPVPEPSTLSLLGGGAAAAIVCAWRRWNVGKANPRQQTPTTN
jgi:hypothetical protein